MAARNGDIKAVKDLVAAGAPLGIGTTTFLGNPGPPLRSAVENDNIEVLKFLISAGASDNDPAAKKAAFDLATQIERNEAIALLRKYMTATK